jgi:hypothetical protein
MAFALTGSALGVFAWRVASVDPSQPQRLIGELRFAQAMAILLAVTGGAWLGLAVRGGDEPLAGLDVTASAAAAVTAAFALVSDPRRALGVLAGAFMVHALIDVAHRPGWLAPSIAPRWFTVGCAAYDVYLAALCYWARRR